jgi:hypothetical protein
VGRSFREAPEIDGVVELPTDIPSGTFARVEVVGALGPDLVARHPGGPRHRHGAVEPAES